MLGLFTAALLSLASGAPDPSGPIGVGDDDVPAPPRAVTRMPPRAAWPSDPRGVRQELGFGLHATTFWSRESSQYTFYSLGLTYLRSSGSWGPFIRATGFVPVQARQDGRVHAASSVYGRRIGGELLLGWQRRWYPSPSTELELGPGLHAELLWMPGAAGYRDFSAMPIGIGGEAVLRWRTGVHVGHSTLRVGQFLNVGVDVFDPLRSNDLRNGFSAVLGAIIGLDDG